MSTTKKIVLIPVITFAVCLCAVSAYAYFTTTAKQSANAQTGMVQVNLDEDFPPTDGAGAELSTVKTFSGTSTGNKMTYVRAHIFAAPEYLYFDPHDSNAPGQWRPLSIPVSAFTITTSAPDWTWGADGYLYYKQILHLGDMTTEATVTVQVSDPSYLPANTDIRLNVRVVLESAQATNNAWKVLFNIASLPAGVESL